MGLEARDRNLVGNKRSRSWKNAAWALLATENETFSFNNYRIEFGLDAEKRNPAPDTVRLQCVVVDICSELAPSQVQAVSRTPTYWLSCAFLPLSLMSACSLLEGRTDRNS